MVRRSSAMVRWSNRTLEPSDWTVAPSDWTSHLGLDRRTVAPSSHRTALKHPTVYSRRSRNISNNTSSSSLPSITTCSLNRPHSTNPRPR